MRDYITSMELKHYLDDGWKMIDVRSPQELTYLKKYPGAINIPYPKVIDEMTTLFPDKKSKLIMFCNAGNRSGVSARAYRKNGYDNVYLLLGGMEGLDK
ncbi:rhodanese-related sulfurtransferase [Entomoplasma freundtii]|uniref:Sulfurtransferase n=1 Tax=Entomoplasma freundtii TaxID=74700 RepID=A0A2K8NS91_9MOLU|nr:rhodanese-like domain-containing protein [Entomoplasma freundtii]ATZ16679.1 sulfurtransferase [Entomoplasma freundtii]TDY58154.1 rhodanese-related sulfurtransferase [Entomoplasma freundtii]